MLHSLGSVGKVLFDVLVGNHVCAFLHASPLAQPNAEASQARRAPSRGTKPTRRVLHHVGAGASSRQVPTHRSICSRRQFTVGVDSMPVGKPCASSECHANSTLPDSH